MTNRREVLMQMAAGAAAIPAIAAGAGWDDKDDCKCVRLGGPHADYFPNVVVTTHEGRRALFYNDLLRGKTMLINFLSIGDKAAGRVMENLIEVQRLLGDRAGREVFIYSLTLDPEHDTPRALRAFAERHGAGPGWLLLTGKPEIMQGLRGRLFLHEGGNHHQGHAATVYDCSAGLIRYGNEAAGLWGAVPARAAPARIVERLGWIAARPQPTGAPKRRGPR